MYYYSNLLEATSKSTCGNPSSLSRFRNEMRSGGADGDVGAALLRAVIESYLSS